MKIECHLIHPSPGDPIDDTIKWGIYVVDEKINKCVAVTEDYKLADELKIRAFNYIINYSTVPFEGDHLNALQNKMFQSINPIIEINNQKLSVFCEHDNSSCFNLYLYKGNKKYKLIKKLTNSNMIMEIESVGNKILSLVNEMDFFYIKNNNKNNIEFFNNKVHYKFSLDNRISITKSNYITVFNKINEETIYNWGYASSDVHSIVESFIIDLFETLKDTNVIYNDI